MDNFLKNLECRLESLLLKDKHARVDEVRRIIRLYKKNITDSWHEPTDEDKLPYVDYLGWNGFDYDLIFWSPTQKAWVSSYTIEPIKPTPLYVMKVPEAPVP